ncbi:MAG TPA: hypothetical protein VF188_00860 [Longimicrobiales bacterium]
MDPDALRALHRARTAEKEQSLFYRGLAAQAEAAGEFELAERLNGLHADEQHHLSRLSARLLELGEGLEDLRALSAPTASLSHWETVAREREDAEVARYEAILALPLDDETAARIREFLRVEKLHARTLTGKWTMG